MQRAPPGVIAKSLQFERALAAQIILLAPMAPYFASELWAGFQSAPNRVNEKTDDFDWNKDVLKQSWPQIDWDYKLDLVCQVTAYYLYFVRCFNVRDFRQMDVKTP